MKPIWPYLAQDYSGVYITQAKGAYLYTKSGNKILDAAGGAIVNNIGHGRKEVAEVIKQATIKNSYVLPPWTTPEREELVEELTEYWLPSELNRIHLSSGGSEANEAAIKISIQYQASKGKTKKNLILNRSLSYHGTTISMTGISGHTARKRGLESYLIEPHSIETPYPLRCPLGKHHPEAKDYYLNNLEEVIKSLGAENIAALIAEPLNGSSGGAIAPPQGYWLEAQKILTENEILLIADEVMTGFGRVGKKFACDLYGLKPDIIVAGKGMAGGYAAIAGTYTTNKIAESIKQAGYEVMFHTFAALPLSCAAATCVLKILRKEKLVEASAAIGKKLKDHLTEELKENPLVAEIRGEGLLLGIEVVKNKDTLELFEEKEKITSKIINYAFSEGVFFYPGGTGEVRDIICLGPPFIINEAEIDFIVSSLKKSLDHIKSKYL